MKNAFIISYERPIYLWVTLDSLYRATKSEVRFTLIDQNSRDPLVHQVIDAFSKRGLIHEVIKCPNNSPQNIWKTISKIVTPLDDIFFYIENDVCIENSSHCWADTMYSIMLRNENIAMLGSIIDDTDFTSKEKIEGILGREATNYELDLIKWRSPERKMSEIGSNNFADQYNPPGRLLALRTSALNGCSSFTDSVLSKDLKEKGWSVFVTEAVKHRHLSLYNFYDYYDYNMEKRDDFMSGLDRVSKRDVPRA